MLYVVCYNYIIMLCSFRIFRYTYYLMINFAYPSKVDKLMKLSFILYIKFLLNLIAFLFIIIS